MRDRCRRGTPGGGFFFSFQNQTDRVSHIDFEPTVQRWWGDMRTPLSLIKEPDGSYTMFFTAYRDRPVKFGMLSKLSLRLTFVD